MPERCWRTLMDHLYDIVLTLDESGRVDYSNRKSFGLAPSEIAGLHYSEFSQNHGQIGEAIERVLAGGAPEQLQTDLRETNGQICGGYAAHVWPIVQDGRLRGVTIVASNITERVLSAKSLRQSELQLKELSTRQLSSLEEERKRIARELHDELGQLLTVLNLDLDWMERRLQEAELLERLESMKQIVDLTMSTVRRMTYSLRPPLLAELGPAPALHYLVQSTCERAGLEYKASLTPLNGLSESCSLVIYRVCQEALTNVVRHARARRVEVELAYADGRALLCVQDDGVGVDPGTLESSLGIRGMRERVELLRGELTVMGQRGKGTCVRAQIPID